MDHPRATPAPTLPHAPPASEIGPGLRGFWAALPREGRYLLSTVALQHLGRGMALPFTIVYFHEVRGFALDTSGGLLSLMAVVAFAFAAPLGTLLDRVGARVMVIFSGVTGSLAALALASADTLPLAVLAMLLMGLGMGSGWSASYSFIAALVAGPLRMRYFGVNFALLNLGIGAGGLIGGLVVDVERPGTFVAMYLVNAVLVLIPTAWLLGPLRHVHGRARSEPGDPKVGYRDALRLPGLGWVLALTAVCSLVGYGQLEAGMPAFARTVAEVGTGVLGIAFAANTAVIVLLQFTVLQRIEGYRRTRVVQVMLLIWVIAWVLLGASGLVPATLAASVLVVAHLTVFGLGETLLQPTVPAMVNDLAPDRVRGRVNALSSAAYNIGPILGPLLAGSLLARQWAGAYIALMIALLTVAALIARRAEGLLPPAANGIAEDRPSLQAD